MLWSKSSRGADHLKNHPHYSEVLTFFATGRLRGYEAKHAYDDCCDVIIRATVPVLTNIGYQNTRKTVKGNLGHPEEISLGIDRFLKYSRPAVVTFDYSTGLKRASAINI